MAMKRYGASSRGALLRPMGRKRSFCFRNPYPQVWKYLCERLLSRVTDPRVDHKYK